ncbi:MAG: hypothetical protein P8L68_10720 [Paracoccaceae bacterium]|nr:hypothetical protein [Paracoccaceae bacterium]MDG2258954.1 hypothetical protein [Paracoccaceae bacterium]
MIAIMEKMDFKVHLFSLICNSFPIIGGNNMHFKYINLSLNFLKNLGLGIVGVLCASFASAASTDLYGKVDGKRFKFTTIYGQYSDSTLAAQLEANAWWGDSVFSESVSAVVGDDLGTAGPLQPFASALAAYATDTGFVSVTFNSTGTTTTVD